MHAEFVSETSNEWMYLLGHARHDAFHLPEYVATMARYEGGQPLLYVAREGDNALLIPMIERLIPSSPGSSGNYRDATCPYGYPGPVLIGSRDTGIDGFLSRAVRRFVSELGNRSVVTAFMRLHPLLSVPLEPMKRAGDVMNHGETVSVDLTLPEDVLWSQTRSNHRRDINKAKRNGLVVRVDEHWNEIHTFASLYHDTMRRQRAGSYYFFPLQLFLDMRKALGGRLHHVVVEVDGKVVSAGLFTEVDGVVQYFLSGTHEAYLPYSPLKTMIHFVRSWARERGNYVLHLGGGLGGNDDDLFRFKTGFSPCLHPFHTWRVIADREAYNELVDQWAEAHPGQRDLRVDYFPRYRA
jgi:hypothetical protein